MTQANYRIESNHPFINRLLPAQSMPRLYEDASLAVAVAVKSVTRPLGQEIRVIHVPTGEVVFRTTPPAQSAHTAAARGGPSHRPAKQGGLQERPSS